MLVIIEAPIPAFQVKACVQVLAYLPSTPGTKGLGSMLGLYRGYSPPKRRLKVTYSTTRLGYCISEIIFRVQGIP